ncbi:MAG: PAS domain-containing protein [Alphaproteobacteria bacterium]|nr:PAS domain-containing protein [Alphaproteobacteria bacterium]
MAKYAATPTNNEATFGTDEIIVSKTDPKGRITYANDVFRRVAQFSEKELIGEPHSLVRHPDMPRAVFKLLWDTLESGSEIFAYVKNMARNGDYYWVLAHVTPSFDQDNNIVGYHSNRRCPTPEAIAKIEPIYQQLLEIENKNPDRKQGMEQAFQAMVDLLKENGVSYDEFVFSL